MESRIRRLLAMAARILDFVRGQPASTDPAYNALVSELQTLVARADEVALDQRNGTVAQSAAIQRRYELRTRMTRVQLRYVARVARQAAKTNPDFARQIVMPAPGSTLKDFVTAARALYAAALPQKELLSSLGLAANVLDDLNTSLAGFDDATLQAHGGQSGHVSARAELRLLGRDILGVADALDGWFEIQFADAPQSLAAWKVARNVVGPIQRSTAEPTPSPAPAPAPAADGDASGGAPEAS